MQLEITSVTAMGTVEQDSLLENREWIVGEPERFRLTDYPQSKKTGVDSGASKPERFRLTDYPQSKKTGVAYATPAS